MPREVWARLLNGAKTDIDILVYAGLFLAEDSGVQRILADKAKSGVRIRILLGDQDSTVVAERGEDEGVGDAMAVHGRRHRTAEPPGA